MLEFLTRNKTAMPSAGEALPGRDTAIVTPGDHAVLGTPMAPPFPEGTERLVFGMGCFWGAEQKFWRARVCYTHRGGLRGGLTPNPTYQEVCSGARGTTRWCSWCSTRPR